jgi:hypothetical protein
MTPPAAFFIGDTVNEISTRRPSLARPGEHLPLLVEAILGDDQRDVAADRLGGAVAEHSLGRRVPRRDDAVERLADDGVGRGVDDGGQSPLGGVDQFRSDRCATIIIRHADWSLSRCEKVFSFAPAPT